MLNKDGILSDNYNQIDFGASRVRNSLQPPQLTSNPSSARSSFGTTYPNTRSLSDSGVLTVHDMRKQSVNLMSPMKQLRSVATLASNSSVASEIVPINFDPEKRLSIRPQLTVPIIVPLPRCSEGSEDELLDEPPRHRIKVNFNDRFVYKIEGG